MRHATACAVLTGAGLLAAGVAAAQDFSCRVDTFPLEQRAFGLSRVRSGPAVHLGKDITGCPNATPACRTGPFAVAGEVVLTGRPHGPYVCVYRPGRDGGGSAGWMPTNRLSALRVSASPPLSAWLGNWASGRNTIDIARDGDELAGIGHAAWPSVFPLPEPKSGGKHSAKFSAQSRPQANRIEFRNGAANDQTACLVSLVLVDRWLVAEDNAKCGGMNVTFTGVYQRR